MNIAAVHLVVDEIALDTDAVALAAFRDGADGTGRGVGSGKAVDGAPGPRTELALITL